MSLLLWRETNEADFCLLDIFYNQVEIRQIGISWDGRYIYICTGMFLIELLAFYLNFQPLDSLSFFQMDSFDQLFYSIGKVIGSNIINSNAAISGCQWQLAYQLLNEVTLMFCRPTVITWNSIMSCLSKATEWQRFFRIFEDMTSHNVTPDIISYNTSISGISGIGGIREESQWHLALHFLNEATVMLNLQATWICFVADF